MSNRKCDRKFEKLIQNMFLMEVITSKIDYDSFKNLA